MFIATLRRFRAQSVPPILCFFGSSKHETSVHEHKAGSALGHRGRHQPLNHINSDSPNAHRPALSALSAHTNESSFSSYKFQHLPPGAVTAGAPRNLQIQLYGCDRGTDSMQWQAPKRAFSMYKFMRFYCLCWPQGLQALLPLLQQRTRKPKQK